MYPRPQIHRRIQGQRLIFHFNSLATISLLFMKRKPGFQNFSRTISRTFLIPHSIVFLVFFCLSFSLNFIQSLVIQVLIRKELKIWDSKISKHHTFTTELQSEQVQTRSQNFAPTLALKWYPQDLIGLVKSLQPVRIRAAKEFSARAFSVWPAKWRVFKKAVCHLAARIDNNAELNIDLKSYL